MHTVDRQARGIPLTGTNMFVNDDGSTRHANRLIGNQGYHDKDTVDTEVVYHHTSIASRWSTILWTRALRTHRHKGGGKDIATYIHQNQIFDLGLRPGLVKGTLSNCFKEPGCKRAIQSSTCQRCPSNKAAIGWQITRIVECGI